MQCPSAPASPGLPSRPLPKSTAAAGQATLREIFADHVVDGAATGFALGQIGEQLKGQDKPLLWIQDRVTQKEAGRPCLAGLPPGLQIIHVSVNKAIDVLWAMEEGLRCTTLAGVMGEVWGDPPHLDFTATKRLALRAETHNVPAWLMRRAAHPNLSAARERWRLTSLPSLGHPYDPRAPGQAQWQADLFRARWRTPGQWVVQHGPARGLQFGHHTNSDHPAAQQASG